LLVPYLLEAVRLLESGVASREDIDQAMKLGCGYPMGPFTLLDLVGLDTTLYVAEVMFQEFREARFAPPPLLRRMVLAGHLGRKTGKGFYDHPAREGRDGTPGVRAVRPCVPKPPRAPAEGPHRAPSRAPRLPPRQRPRRARGGPGPGG